MRHSLPVCKEKHIVGKCQRYVEQPNPIAPSGDETQYVGASAQQSGGDETRIGSSPIARVGMLVDNKGATYQLCIGINTIEQKDQLILNNGDRIKMGNTELTFKK